MARKPSLLSPLRLARRRAINQGFLGGSKLWTALGVVLWLPRLARKGLGRNEEVVAVEKLLPGERVVITALAQDTPEQRRMFKRT